MIKVYGASDDLIEVDGRSLRSEFYHYSDERPSTLEFSDGTVLSVRYNEDGCWEVRPQVEGTAYHSHVPYTDPEGNYSDVVQLREPLMWVKFHEVQP